MAAFKHKALLSSYKRRIQKKLDDVVDEAENACSVIQELTLKVKTETESILDEDDEVFFEKYTKLQEELANLSEKLFLSLSIISSPEENIKEEKPKRSELELPINSASDYQRAGSSLESQKQSSQASDISPSTDSGICVKSQSNGLESSGKKSPLPGLLVTDSPPPLISEEDESLSPVSVSAKSSSERKSSQQSSASASCASRDTISSFDDRQIQDHTSSTGSELNDGVLQGMDEEKCFSELSAASLRSFASANSNLDSSYRSFAESSVQDLMSQDVLLGETVQAPITVFRNPSDFWMQLENHALEEILKSCHFPAINPADVKKLRYCVVPFERSGCYQRAKILSVSGSGADTQAEVMFIDSGDLEIVHISEMREMPKLLYEYPPQAVHCFLHGVVPVGNAWSAEAVDAFEEIRSYSDFQVTILGKQDDMYAVRITVILHVLEGIDSYDFAQMLCLLKHARSEMPSDWFSSTISSSDEHDVQYCEKSPQSDARDVMQTSHSLNPYAKEFVVEEYQSHSANENSSNCHLDSRFDEQVLKNLEPLEAGDIYMSDEDSELAVGDNLVEHTIEHLASSDHVDSVNRPIENIVNTVMSKSSHSTHEWNLNAVLPSPRPFFVDDDMMIVIPSVIYSPSCFYCNVAMDNSLELDELRDMMTNLYNSLDKSEDVELTVDDIKEKMFLACSFDDGYWYRVQVDGICDTKTSNNHPKIIVTFIDYGNEKSVNIEDLRPLTAQFAKYPILGILCSLAYIKPEGAVCESTESSPLSMKWDKSSTDRFHELTKNEKVLTAQISKFQALSDDRVLYEVFLWDTGENGDRMINDILVEEGFAEYHNSVGVIPRYLKSPDSKKKEPAGEEMLDEWDPMQDDFDNVLNSYGIDARDAEIATVGYKATDESYVCKYFARDGSCYRGNRCPYKHVAPGYRDATLDQELVYACDNDIILPDEGTHCLLQVSCIQSAWHFYVLFPFGTEPVSEFVDTSAVTFPRETEFELLTTALNEHYAKSFYSENAAIAPACGTMVAAKSQFDGSWYRARIKAVDDVDRPVQVFYVDFGTTEWIDRRNIRQLEPQFLHCRFQAVEAFLANIDSPRVKDEAKWANKAMTTFEALVKNKTFLAYINRKIGSVLFVTLKLNYTDGNVEVINNILVEEGMARFASQTSMFFSPDHLPLAKKDIIYVPG